MINRVFVYGTLMEGMENYWLIRPYVVTITPAILAGAEIFHLSDGYPALIISNSSACVKGEVMELLDIEKVLPLLDDLEDYHGDSHLGNLYDRKVITVQCKNGKQIEAYVYAWNRSNQLSDVGIPVKDGCWRSFLKDIQNINNELI